MTRTEQIINKADNSYLAIYRRFPIAFDHGDGVYLYDAEGKEYLDCKIFHLITITSNC